MFGHFRVYAVVSGLAIAFSMASVEMGSHHIPFFLTSAEGRAALTNDGSVNIFVFSTMSFRQIIA